MANYMEQVAKMLGVEMGEEFEILWPDGRMPYDEDIYCFKDNGLYAVYTNVQAHRILACLLTGAAIVKHKPWKPEFEDIYWRIDLNGTVTQEVWTNTVFDYNLYKIGNCYRTQKEAEANRDKWLDFYASDEVLEV